MFKVAVGSCFAFAIGKTTNRIDNSIFDETTVNESHQISSVQPRLNEGPTAGFDGQRQSNVDQIGNRAANPKDDDIANALE